MSNGVTERIDRLYLLTVCPLFSWWSITLNVRLGKVINYFKLPLTSKRLKLHRYNVRIRHRQGTGKPQEVLRGEHRRIRSGVYLYRRHPRCNVILLRPYYPIIAYTCRPFVNIFKPNIRPGSSSASSVLTACVLMCHCTALQRKYIHTANSFIWP
jgi:hypothetical protein